MTQDDCLPGSSCAGGTCTCPTACCADADCKPAEVCRAGECQPNTGGSAGRDACATAAGHAGLGQLLLDDLGQWGAECGWDAGHPTRPTTSSASRATMPSGYG